MIKFLSALGLSYSLSIIFLWINFLYQKYKESNNQSKYEHIFFFLRFPLAVLSFPTNLFFLDLISHYQSLYRDSIREESKKAADVLINTNFEHCSKILSKMKIKEDRAVTMYNAQCEEISHLRSEISSLRALLNMQDSPQ